MIGPIAGALVEGFDHRHTMIATDLIRGGLVGVLLVSPGSGAIWVVYLVAALQAGVSEFFAPARTALIPALVRTESLAKANGTMSIGSELALLLGPASGGLTYGVGGLRAAVAIDTVSYLISAGATGLLPRTGRDRVGRRTLRVEATARSLGSGLAFAGREPLLRTLFAANLIMAVGAGILGVAIVTFARRDLGVGGLDYGVMLSAQSIGGLAGAWLSRRITGALSDKAWVSLSFGLIGLAVAGVAASNRWWLAAMVLLAGGTPTTLGLVVVTTLVQLTPPESYRARTASIYRWTSMAGLAIGSVIAGPLAAGHGSRAALAVSAGLIGISAVLAGWRMPGRIRRRVPTMR